MLSSKCAEILSLLESNRSDEILDMETFEFLKSKKYIAYDGKQCAYVTTEGNAELEDYFHYMKALEREEKTLDLSRQSIKKSSTANVLSIVAISASSVISVVSLLVSIFVH